VKITSPVSHPIEQLDKTNPLPVYAQLAQILRRLIASGTLKPGARIPSEASLAKQHDVSPMTVRQAVGVLVEEGLVNRVHGSGTFVKRVEVAATHFGLDALQTVLSDQENLEVKILKTTMTRAEGVESEILKLAPGDPVIFMERLILHQDAPFSLQSAYIIFDPEAPVVEGMLDTTVLTGLLFSQSPSGFKKSELRLLPMTMDKHEADMLDTAHNDNAFRLEYVFYNFDDSPSAYGWFIIPHLKMPLVSRVGVWND
jgi:DNA-binding GntR family transcriptional regulator